MAAVTKWGCSGAVAKLAVICKPFHLRFLRKYRCKFLVETTPNLKAITTVAIPCMALVRLYSVVVSGA